jgi:hypothetical protein
MSHYAKRSHVVRAHHSGEGGPSIEEFAESAHSTLDGVIALDDERGINAHADLTDRVLECLFPVTDADEVSKAR